MSNLEAHPEEARCQAGGQPNTEGNRPDPSGPMHEDAVAVEIITHREVPLGGPRALMVRRTLPQRKRSLIGAWCFADHYGPSDVATTGGMDVAPHPHTGLQTVSWLFDGEIAHIDSGGNTGMVRPGEVNLMTSGAGICHSETSPSHVDPLHGVQLWVALPDSVRNTAPRAFEHYEPERVALDGGSTLVFIGSLAGETSPVTVHTPLLGAELSVDPGATLTLDVDENFEHGLLVDSGEIYLEGTAVPAAAIGYTGIGAGTLRIHNAATEPARLILLGGEPFEEEILMWWNFVARNNEEIQHAREQWQNRTELFGTVGGYVGHGGENKNAYGQSWLPAPKLPNGAIKPRKNPAPTAREDIPEPGESPEFKVLRRR